MPDPETVAGARAFAAEIHARLLAAYGAPTWRASYPPMEELVLTFLSQSTSDINSGRAFAALRRVTQPGRRFWMHPSPS